MNNSGKGGVWSLKYGSVTTCRLNLKHMDKKMVLASVIREMKTPVHPMKGLKDYFERFFDFHRMYFYQHKSGNGFDRCWCKR